ncbi:hypothetical protein BV25DRAFT_1920135 [Artomyces pyxidatus]|uniref:Uncharacterized protein n=1 Tax=Artomyces pyxidatus TaxID=48021 RepID=A0ACB8SMI0_9AGAM|nr:hypothetical protein BV25DRAFT_1920135 [Artomyces pyxidatus]
MPAEFHQTEDPDFDSFTLVTATPGTVEFYAFPSDLTRPPRPLHIKVVNRARPTSPRVSASPQPPHKTAASSQQQDPAATYAPSGTLHSSVPVHSRRTSNPPGPAQANVTHKTLKTQVDVVYSDDAHRHAPRDQVRRTSEVVLDAQLALPVKREDGDGTRSKPGTRQAMDDKRVQPANGFSRGQITATAAGQSKPHDGGSSPHSPSGPPARTRTPHLDDGVNFSDHVSETDDGGYSPLEMPVPSPAKAGSSPTRSSPNSFRGKGKRRISRDESSSPPRKRSATPGLFTQGAGVGLFAELGAESQDRLRNMLYGSHVESPGSREGYR